MQRQVLKQKHECAERPALTVAVDESENLQAISVPMLGRTQICPAGEALRFIFVPQRQNRSGYNNADSNDTPEMTTSTQNIPLSPLSLCSLVKARSGNYLYVNALNILIINICFELYFKLVMRLSNQELTGSLCL